MPDKTPDTAGRSPCPRLVISAAHKSSGKTVTAIGLCAAIAKTGLTVQPFKKGPDYIDPMWLTAAAGKDCSNLDYFMFGWDKMESLFKKQARTADLSIIEGNKGLHDSVETDGEGSTANLARRLGAPVVLVMDASRITRGIAPLLLGYKTFEPDVNIAGVILNKVSSARHESKLKSVLDKYTDIPLLGAVRRTPDLEIMERHLGLIPVKENAKLKFAIDNIRRQIEYSVDVKKVIEIAASAPEMETGTPQKIDLPPARVKIGVMMDHAFTFYYPENLQALREAGAELVPVNAIRDGHLPEDLDGIYIGGGFPETLMDELEKNKTMREDVRLAAQNGMPIHAECGGLIYLAKNLTWNGKKRKMAGALNCGIVVNKKPKGHGYMVLEPTGKSAWIKGNGQIRAHEFHYGEVVNLGHADFAFRVVRGTGIDGKNDGIVYNNVMASFAHLHHIGCPNWAADFVSHVEKIKFSENARPRIAVSGMNNKNLLTTKQT